MDFLGIDDKNYDTEYNIYVIKDKISSLGYDWDSVFSEPVNYFFSEFADESNLFDEDKLTNDFTACAENVFNHKKYDKLVSGLSQDELEFLVALMAEYVSVLVKKELKE